MLWNQAVHTDREVTANRPDIVIKNNKETYMWQYPQTEMLCKSGKEVKMQEFAYRDAANVEPEMYGRTGNNWSHWNGNEKLKENLEAVPGKHSIDSLQKTAVLGTAHTIRKVLQCEA